MDAQAGYKPIDYRIVVQGRLDESWSNWLSGMSVSVDQTEDGMSVTTLAGPVVDQPALRGILNRLWDLNLTLISVNQISNEPSREEANR